MDVFLFLNRRAATIRGIEQFITQLVDHSLFTASARVDDDPANRERGAAIGNTPRGQRAADYVIAHARQILNATASDEHDRVLLQVVADTRNVSRNFNPVREPDARDFSQRRVRLLRCLGIDTSTDPSLLRASL